MSKFCKLTVLNLGDYFMKKLAISLCVLMMLAGMVHAQVTVEMWYHSGRAEERSGIQAILDRFAEKYPDIQIELVKLPEGSYNEQVQAAALAGDLPCVLDFDGPNLYNYAWSGYMLPIDGYISDEMKADFLPSIIAQGTYAGKLYSLGTYDSGLAIWGNKVYLEKAGVRIPTGLDDPWDQAEFMDALAKLQALEEVEYALDMKMNYGFGEWVTYGFSPIVQAFGGDLIDRSDYQSADGVLNGEKSVEALTFLQSLFTDGYVNPKPAGDDSFYGTKTAALAYVGHWMWGPHSEGLGDDLVLLPMPKFGDNVVVGMGSWNWGITSSCPNPDEAWNLMEHLVSPEEIVTMTNGNGAVPARKSALAQSDLYAEGGPLNLLFQQLDSGLGMPRPITPAYPVITSAFAEAFKNIVAAGADVQAELDNAVKKIDQDIADNQGYPMPE
jgi:multiple sugar transport system substrate-binding protein